MILRTDKLNFNFTLFNHLLLYVNYIYFLWLPGKREILMVTVLITGASRGLGLEFVKQYQKSGAKIFACCRNPENANNLMKLANESNGQTTLFQMDVSNPKEVLSTAKELNGCNIDYLINNAGILGTDFDQPMKGAFGSVDYESWEETMLVNVLGPFGVCEAFVNHVSGSKNRLMVFVSTHMASITALSEGGFYPYRSSKAALNLLVKGLSIDLKDRGIRTLSFHPGWVKTDMGTDSAPVEVSDSISGMREVISSYSSPRTGEFINYDGTPYPW